MPTSVQIYKPRKPLWTSVGNEITGTSVQEVLTQAGLNWDVSKVPMITHVPGNPHFDSIHIPEHIAIVRNDNQAILGVLGSGYEIIQNSDPIEMVFELTKEKELHFDVAGSMLGGKIGYIFCKVPHPIIVGPDSLDFYLIMQWSHSGSHALTCHFKITDSLTNIVYGVTLPHLKHLKGDYKFKHTKKCQNRIKELVGIYEMGAEFRQQTETVLNSMLMAPWNISQMNDYLKELFPKAETSIGENRRENQRKEVISLFKSDRSPIGNTAYAAIKAVTYWVDNDKSSKQSTKKVVIAGVTKEITDTVRTEENDLQSVLFSSKAALKEKAFIILKKAI